MKLTVSVILGAACVLAGCASTPSVAPSDPVAYQERDAGVDFRKVASIDRVARERGVEIHWIHFPQRRPGNAPDVVVSPAPDLSTGT